jgi:hypothetical protein
MAAQVRGTFPELYDNVDKAVRSILKDALQELKPIYTSYYNTRTSDRKFERIMTVTPFGDVPEKPEGEVYSLDVIRPGHTKDFTHVEFGLGFEVTETALEDDQYDQLNRAATWLAYSARYVQETRAAAPLNNGFSTEETGDGQPLFDTAHVLAGGGTARNELNPGADLSVASLIDAMVDSQLQTKLESGQLVAPITGWTLIVPPALEFLAYRIVNSAGLPGSADNDTNPLKALRSIKIVVNPHLSDTDAWFLLASNKSMHGLTTYTRKPITQVPPATDPYTGNRIYKVRFRQSWGAWMWQGAFASEGA